MSDDFNLECFILDDEPNFKNLYSDFDFENFKEKYFNKIISIVIYKLSNNKFKIDLTEKSNSKLQIIKILPDLGYNSFQKYKFLISLFDNINSDFEVVSNIETINSNLDLMFNRGYLNYRISKPSINNFNDTVSELEVDDEI